MSTDNFLQVTLIFVCIILTNASVLAHSNRISALEGRLQLLESSKGK